MKDPILEAYSQVINEELDMNMDLKDYLGKIEQSIKTLTGYKKTFKSLMTFINVGNLINKGVNAFDGDVDTSHGGGNTDTTPQSFPQHDDSLPTSDATDIHDVKEYVKPDGTKVKEYTDKWGYRHQDTVNTQGDMESTTGKTIGHVENPSPEVVKELSKRKQELDTVLKSTNFHPIKGSNAYAETMFDNDLDFNPDIKEKFNSLTAHHKRGIKFLVRKYGANQVSDFLKNHDIHEINELGKKSYLYQNFLPTTGTSNSSGLTADALKKFL